MEIKNDRFLNLWGASELYLFSKVRTCIQLYTTGGMSMKNYCFHSILMLYWVLSFCTFGDVVRTIEITKIEMPPNITFSFPCETKIEDRKIKSKGEIGISLTGVRSEYNYFVGFFGTCFMEDVSTLNLYGTSIGLNGGWKNLYGCSFSFINKNNAFYGWQTSFLGNVSNHQSIGLQVSCIYNFASSINGIQVALLNEISKVHEDESSKTYVSSQIGLLNECNTDFVFQAGIFNKQAEAAMYALF